MNTSAVNSSANGQPAGDPAAPAPQATPPSAPVPAPEATSPNPGAPAAPSSTPPAAPAGQPSGAQKPDPLANSNWPDSAKDRVRELARKNRESQEEIARNRAYIQKLEEQQSKMTLPKREQFETDEEFVTAVIGYQSKTSALEVEKGRVQGQVEAAEQGVSQLERNATAAKVEAARQEFPDWDQVVNNSQVPVSQHLAFAMHKSERGARIAYILNKMPQEAARLNTLEWHQIMEEFPAIEARYAASHKPPVTAPPSPPIEPVGGAGGAPNRGGYKEWEAQRNSKLGPF